MSDIQTPEEDSWSWSLDKTKSTGQDSKENIRWNNPYEKFILKRDVAEAIVNEFESFGGSDYWISHGMAYSQGAEKEVFIISNPRGETFAISRSLHRENRDIYPKHEKLREVEALKQGNYYFPPAQEVKSTKNNVYIVRKFVAGRPATNQEMVAFENKTGISISGGNNAIIDPDVGLVIIDLGDVTYNRDVIQ